MTLKPVKELALDKTPAMQSKSISQEADLKEFKSKIRFLETHINESHQNVNNQIQEIVKSQDKHLYKFVEKIEILNKNQKNALESQQYLRHDLETKFNDTINNLEKSTYVKLEQHTISFEKQFDKFQKPINSNIHLENSNNINNPSKLA